MSLNDSIKGKSLSYPVEESLAIQNMVSLLNILDNMIDSTPPIKQPQRFGNQAFRHWYNNLKEVCILFLNRFKYNYIFTSTNSILESFGFVARCYTNSIA